MFGNYEMKNVLMEEDEKYEGADVGKSRTQVEGRGMRF